MNTMRGLSTVMVALVLGATALCATGCAADAEPQQDPPLKETTFSAPVTETTQDTNGAPQAPPPTGAEATGAPTTTANGAPVGTSQPRITPKK